MHTPFTHFPGCYSYQLPLVNSSDLSKGTNTSYHDEFLVLRLLHSVLQVFVCLLIIKGIRLLFYAFLCHLKAASAVGVWPLLLQIQIFLVTGFLKNMCPRSGKPLDYVTEKCVLLLLISYPFHTLKLLLKYESDLMICKHSGYD